MVRDTYTTYIIKMLGCIAILALHYFYIPFYWEDFRGVRYYPAYIIDNSGSLHLNEKVDSLFKTKKHHYYAVKHNGGKITEGIVEYKGYKSLYNCIFYLKNIKALVEFDMAGDSILKPTGVYLSTIQKEQMGVDKHDSFCNAKSIYLIEHKYITHDLLYSIIKGIESEILDSIQGVKYKYTIIDRYKPERSSHIDKNAYSTYIYSKKWFLLRDYMNFFLDNQLLYWILFCLFFVWNYEFGR